MFLSLYQWLWRLRRQYKYRLQRFEFFIRQRLPRPLFQLLKPSYRKFSKLAASKKTDGLYRRFTPPASQSVGYAIICFPIITWEYRFQRPQQLLTCFAKAGHRVFYLRTDFRQADLELENIDFNITGLRLPGPTDLDIYGAPLTPEQVDLWLESFEKLRLSEGLTEVICLVQLPFWGPLALAARQRWGWRVVYDCIDEYSGFPAVRPEMLKHEEPLIRNSDLVLTTAQALYQKCVGQARQCILLPNAADFEHFQQSRYDDPLPDLVGPIIGYYGALSEWFETEFVRAAAVRHPDWQFVIIGTDADAKVQVLEQLPNVHLLGEQPYQALPDYLHRFDAAIIPFKLNKLTRAVDPVKFYEYISAGKPVIATPLPELEPYQDLIYMAASPAEFVDQLERALKEDDSRRVAARLAFAKSNIWADRVARLDEHIRQLYPRVSIILVTHNHLELLQKCLNSLWAKTVYPNYEVVIVDNGSTTDVVEYLQYANVQQRRLRVIFNTGDLGKAQAVNIGLSATENSDYIVLLNYDTLVPHGWVHHLVKHLEFDPTIGMIGPITAWASDESRFVTGYYSVDDLDVFAERQAKSHIGQSHALPTLDMFCVALRRAVIQEIGLLDERFGQGIFEDADYAIRLRQAGYFLKRAEDVVVHHWSVAQPAPVDRAAADQQFESNRQLFEAKWGRYTELSSAEQLFNPALPTNRKGYRPR